MELIVSVVVVLLDGPLSGPREAGGVCVCVCVYLPANCGPSAEDNNKMFARAGEHVVLVRAAVPVAQQRSSGVPPSRPAARAAHRRRRRRRPSHGPSRAVSGSVWCAHAARSRPEPASRSVGQGWQRAGSTVVWRRGARIACT